MGRAARQAFLGLVGLAIVGEVVLFQALRPTPGAEKVAAQQAHPAPVVVVARATVAVQAPMPPAGPSAGAPAPAQPTESRPADPPSATPEPAPTWTPGPEADLPIVPVIDGAMKDRLRAIHETGLAGGMQPQVFAKVGDSISASGFFLTGFGCGTADLDAFTDLATVVEHFRAVELPAENAQSTCGAGNSFTRGSHATGVGWSARQVLASMGDPPAECPPPDDTPLRCELRRIRPGAALVMFGTNEAHQRVSPNAFKRDLAAVVTNLVEAGVVPVLSTIPHRLGPPNARIGAINGAIIEVAREQQVPVANYWRALQGPDMVRGGMEPDGIHPNAYRSGASLSPRGLRYGYNQRNLVALQALAKVKRVVFDDGPPD